jgi:NADPH:quinone reductase-like Zn-dependent oxidoreductase
MISKNAAVYERYGPPEVVIIKEIARPEPRDDELLIKTYATRITSGDRCSYDDQTPQI